MPIETESLKRFPLLAGLDSDELEEIAERFRRRLGEDRVLISCAGFNAV